MNKMLLPAAMLATTALLTACPGASTPPAVVYTQPTAIQGTVKNWTAGAGTVAAIEGSTTLASAPLAADGTFSLTLPEAAKVTPYLTTAGTSDFTNVAGCTGALTSSDQNARAYGLSTLTATAGGTGATIMAGTETETSTQTSFTYTLDGRVWMYADRPLTLGGTATCTESVEGVPVTGTLSANAQLKTGWNLLQVKSTLSVTQTADQVSGAFSIAVNNVADGATNWMTSTAAPLSVNSLNPLKTNPRQYLQRQLIQKLFR